MDRLLELSPNDNSRAREAAFGTLSAWERGFFSDARSADEAARRYVEILGKLDPDDPSLAPLKMGIARLEQDYASMRTIAAATAEEDPGLGNYYLAWASYLAGNPGDAKKYLSKVLSLDPGNAFARTSLRELDSGRAGTAGFTPVFVDPIVTSQPTN
jgi:hypothetical protein